MQTHLNHAKKQFKDKDWFIMFSGLGVGIIWHEPKTFRIRFGPGSVGGYFSERTWSDAQKFLLQEDDSLILERTTKSKVELKAWVRSFGEDTELL